MLAAPSIVTELKKVPNRQPYLQPTSLRLAFIHPAPSVEDANFNTPFASGAAATYLSIVARSLHLDLSSCFFGNLCQVPTPTSKLELPLKHDHPDFISSVNQLAHDLRTFNPHICVLFGSSTLSYALGTKANVSVQRGSLFTGTALGPFHQRKCISTFRPVDILTDYSLSPLFAFDLRRAITEASSPDLHLPSRLLQTNLDPYSLCSIMDNWPAGRRCSLDIEGGLEGWPCVSICSTPIHSITIAWSRFSPSDHAKVLRSFSRLMARVDVPKVLQNSLYDNFVLSYGFGILIRNVAEDTMLKGWEIYCELPKGLATQTSIWTREPYYKAERKSGDEETYFRYCAKDSAVTLEICEAQDNVLKGGPAFDHYRSNMDLLNPLHFMQHRGIRYDQASVNEEKAQREVEIEVVANELNAKAGIELRGAKGSLSPKRLQEALYSKMGYPPQYKKEGNRYTTQLTTDVHALLALKKTRPHDTFLDGLLKHRHLEGVLETLNIKPDPDGRVRCGYNAVGTETGRLSCRTSPTGNGANLQTVTKKLRKNYTADPGHDFFQCDLAGADGWTVAAHCARLGDSTMFDDYSAGLKPAKIIAMLYLWGEVVNTLSRPDLLFWSDDERGFAQIKKAAGSWVYDGAKVTQHGSNYGMGLPTTISNLTLQSYKKSGRPIYIESKDAATLQRLYFSRYSGVSTWHNWSEAQLSATGQLTSASGHTRTFFGRRWGKEIKQTLREYLADEPQQNTTYATNLAMLNLWNDPENRVVFRAGNVLKTASGQLHHIPADQAHLVPRLIPGSLIIEPLHQVHDALCGQWPIFLRDWARKKVRSYFNNELKIAGQSITIPFDGAFGPSWGKQPHPL